MENREQKIVITGENNLSEEGIICALCKKLLSRYDKDTDSHSIEPEVLMKSGAIPIPNFGWFCSASCSDSYSAKFDVHFQRDMEVKNRCY